MNLPTAQAAKNARDTGIEQSADTSGEQWLHYATKFVRDYLKSHETMHVDQIWRAGLERPKSPRALGAVIRRASKAGWCAHIITRQGIVSKPSRSSNMQLKAVWKSCLYEEGEQGKDTNTQLDLLYEAMK